MTQERTIREMLIDERKEVPAKRINRLDMRIDYNREEGFMKYRVWMTIGCHTYHFDLPLDYVEEKFVKFCDELIKDSPREINHFYTGRYDND